MKQFTSHLDYLIQCNDCVIIPDFGGFVLNKEDAFIRPDGNIVPPRVVVGFNPDLKYNDGLLAESYMHVQSIPYEAACKKINDAVENINSQLNQKRTVRLGHLGKISLTEKGHLKFIPDQSISLHYPDTYGLSYLNIRPLPEVVKLSARKAQIYKWCTGIAGAAAAVLVFFVSTTPISSEHDNSVQKSGFFIDAITSSSDITESKVEEPTTPNSTYTVTTEELNVNEASEPNNHNTVDINTENSTDNHAIAENIEIPNSTTITVDKKKNPQYYVIVGSANSESELNRINNVCMKDGVTDINTLEIGKNRYRIYIASFENRTDAENYLVNFRKTNPKYKDAWIYTSKS